MRRITKTVLWFAACLALGPAASAENSLSRKYREQDELLERIERRLGPLEAFEVRSSPPRPEWFWKRVVGPQALDVKMARFFAIPPGARQAIGLTADETAIFRYLNKADQLVLGGPAIDDETMESIAQMPKLVSLGLVDTSVTSRGIAKLRGHKSLGGLSLQASQRGSPPISRDAIEALATIRSLEGIALSGYTMDDSGIAALPKAKWKSLHAGEAISAADLEYIGQMRSLTRLSLNGADISDESLAAISKLKNLERITVHDTRVTQEGLERLTKVLPKLNLEPEVFYSTPTDD